MACHHCARKNPAFSDVRERELQRLAPVDPVVSVMLLPVSKGDLRSVMQLGLGVPFLSGPARVCLTCGGLYFSLDPATVAAGVSR